MTVGFHRESLWAPLKYQKNGLYSCYHVRWLKKGLLLPKYGFITRFSSGQKMGTRESDQKELVL
jgi:hypothetical protein